MSGYRPQDFPRPTDRDLDFPDPPDWLRDPWSRVFWCLNQTVREKLTLNREGQNSDVIFFCIKDGFCNFHPNEIGSERRELHFVRNPSHRIYEEDFPGWRDLAEHWKVLRNGLWDRREYSRASSASSSSNSNRARSCSNSRFSRSPGVREENVGYIGGQRSQENELFRGNRNLTFSRNFKARPGTVGKFNSKLGMPISEVRKLETKMRDFACKDRGKFKGCGEIMRDQLEYNEHAKRGNLATDMICPYTGDESERSQKQPVVITLTDEEEDNNEVTILPPPPPPPLPKPTMREKERSQPSIPDITRSPPPQTKAPREKNYPPPDIIQSPVQSQISVALSKLGEETVESEELNSHTNIQSTSSQVKVSNVSISSKKKATFKIRQPISAPPKERKVIKQKENDENDEMSLLLDKKVVRKQQIGLFRQKKSVKKRSVVAESTPRSVKSSRKVSNEDSAWPCSFGAAISLSDAPLVKKALKKKKNKKTNKDKDKKKSQIGISSDLKRKSMELSEEKKAKFRKISISGSKPEGIPRSQTPIPNREFTDEEKSAVNTEPNKMKKDLNDVSHHKDKEDDCCKKSTEDDDIDNLLESGGDDDDTDGNPPEPSELNISSKVEGVEVDDENNNDESNNAPTIIDSSEPEDISHAELLGTPEKESEVSEKSDRSQDEDRNLFQMEAEIEEEEYDKYGRGGDSTDDNDDEDEEEEEFVLCFGKDPCTVCPKCERELGHRGLTINIRTGVMTVYCDNDHCKSRIVVRNLPQDRKKYIVPCGL